MNKINTSSILDNLERLDGKFIDDLYAAMRTKDLTAVVTAALRLPIRKQWPISREEKSAHQSDTYRKMGNSAYVSGRYAEAMKLYNKALRYAPDQSMSMKLCFSNRSALLFKFTKEACNKDIDMCLAMGCPSDITEKLLKRKAQLVPGLQIEKGFKEAIKSTFHGNFFKFNQKQNADIPCANMDIEIITDSEFNEEKVVSTKDIRVGTIFALETAFSHMCPPRKVDYACYYCNNMTLNLIPCNGCCHVMFCNNECMRMSLKEGHKIECQIIDIVTDLQTQMRQALRTALKIKHLCKSWEEFNAISKAIDCEALKHNVTDVIKKIPILMNRTIVDLPYGLMFNFSLSFGCIVHALERVESFLPTPWHERQEASLSFIRVMLYLYIYTNKTIISSCAIELLSQSLELMEPNIGYFSLIGKLSHSCQANTLAVGLNNKIALVAVQPIKCGSEITISYQGQYENGSSSEFDMFMFFFYHRICNCPVSQDHYKLSHAQMDALRGVKSLEKEIRPELISREQFSKLCDYMSCLSNVSHTNEYKDAYKVFVTYIMMMQETFLQNYMIKVA